MCGNRAEGVGSSGPRLAWREIGRHTGIDAGGRKKRRRTKRTHPIGVNVSMPLAADQGRPLDFATSWTFLAVMSTASAVERERMNPRDGLGAHRSRRCDLAHPLGRYRDQVSRSRGQVRLRLFVN